jgi:hypothetical protein
VSTIESNIQKILISAAINKGTVSYKTIYSLFDNNTPQNAVWDTFEMACRNIATPQNAIYGALLRKQGAPFPESGFFELFKNTRQDLYYSITGAYGTMSNNLSIPYKSAILQHELAVVHQHACNI